MLLLSEGASSTRRSEVLSTLSFLPVALATLDLVNRLVAQSRLLSKDETALLLHGFLANAIRGAEGMEERRAQTRCVQLLCLFITSLLRSGVVDVEEVFYEVQELGVRFMFVKEARELWKGVCG